MFANWFVVEMTQACLAEIVAQRTEFTQSLYLRRKCPFKLSVRSSFVILHDRQETIQYIFHKFPRGFAGI